MRIRLLLASLDRVTSAGLQATLEPDFEVSVSEGGHEMLSGLVERHRPNVVIFDPEHVGRPSSGGEIKVNGSGTFAGRHASVRAYGREGRPAGLVPSFNGSPGGGRSARLLAYSEMRDEDFVRDLLAAGVKGYVLRSDPPFLLTMAIRAVAADHTFLTPSLSQIVENALLRPHLDAPTLRESQILRFLAQGKTNKHMAQAMNLSVRTVEAHRMSLMRKLGAHSAAELIRIAIRRGLIEP